jgi:hypothetical protein
LPAGVPLSLGHFEEQPRLGPTGMECRGSAWDLGSHAHPNPDSLKWGAGQNSIEFCCKGIVKHPRLQNATAGVGSLPFPGVEETRSPGCWSQGTWGNLGSGEIIP